MKEHPCNNLDNFISGWYLDNTNICNDIISWFQQFPEKHPGTVDTDSIKPYIKDSTDADFFSAPADLQNEYYKLLQQCADQYVRKYEFCNTYDPWGVNCAFNVQHYKPGQGFFKWHAERTSAEPPANSRHLVFMTYLNDVTDQGETEFYYQKLKVKPEKGLTLIWPADWTFTHRGITSPSEDKYIITGWFNFLLE
jgi:hypothetical protein